MPLEITQNGMPRPLLSLEDLTPAEREQFDWVEDGESFFRYRGAAYALSEFERVPEDAGELTGWSGKAPDSLWTGTLVRIDPADPESVYAGRYHITES